MEIKHIFSSSIAVHFSELRKLEAAAGFSHIHNFIWQMWLDEKY